MDTQISRVLGQPTKRVIRYCQCLIASLVCISHGASANGVKINFEQDYAALMHSWIFFALVAAGVSVSRRYKV